jgi:hypothetical protein
MTKQGKAIAREGFTLLFFFPLLTFFQSKTWKQWMIQPSSTLSLTLYYHSSPIFVQVVIALSFSSSCPFWCLVVFS